MAKALLSLQETAEKKEPTVSVSEAFGLPDNWEKTEMENIARESRGELPEPPEPEPELPETPETPEKPAGAETPAEEDKPETAPKPEEKPAAESKKAKSGKKEPVKEEKPGAKAEPEAAPAKETPVVPAAVAKVKVGDKEYTPEELQALVDKANGVAAAPAAAKVEAPTPAKEPTAEEKAAEEAETKKKDAEWVGKVAPTLNVPLSEETLDKIMAGGAEGVALLKTTIGQAAAHAVLLSRKSLYAEWGPRFAALEEQFAPMEAARMQQEDDREWGVFAAANPDLATHRDLVESSTAAVIGVLGDKAKGMSMADFQKLVAENTRAFATRMRIPLGEVQAAAPAAGTPAAEVTPKVAAGAAAPVVAAKPEVKPAVTARAKVAPPGANTPQATPGKDVKGAKGDSGIIASLW